VTVSPADSRLEREMYLLADVDEVDGAVRCPVCACRLHRGDLKTPTVPPNLLDDATVDVCARAYICTRHRVDIVALEPASIAPETFVPVEAVINGEVARIAVPEPVAEREGLL